MLYFSVIEDMALQLGTVSTDPSVYKSSDTVFYTMNNNITLDEDMVLNYDYDLYNGVYVKIKLSDGNIIKTEFEEFNKFSNYLDILNVSNVSVNSKIESVTKVIVSKGAIKEVDVSKDLKNLIISENDSFCKQLINID